MDFNADLNEVLKYARERLPVSAIHPELRFIRLGAVLRQHATEGGDVGELCHQALTSDHSQPLELMPLHLLRDKMQEEPDHPLAKEANWLNVPDAMSLAQMGLAALRSYPSKFTPFYSGAAGIIRHAARQNGLEVTDGQVQDTVARLQRQAYGRSGNVPEDEADRTHERLKSGEFWMPEARDEALRVERFE